ESAHTGDAAAVPRAESTWCRVVAVTGAARAESARAESAWPGHTTCSESRLFDCRHFDSEEHLAAWDDQLRPLVAKHRWLSRRRHDVCARPAGEGIVGWGKLVASAGDADAERDGHVHADHRDQSCDAGRPA